MRVPTLAAAFIGLLCTMPDLPLDGGGRLEAQANDSAQSTLIAFQDSMTARLDQRVRNLESTRNLSSDDRTLLKEFRQRLADERGLKGKWAVLGTAETQATKPRAAGKPPAAIVFGGASGVAAIEKDWRLVFDYFPGLRARFVEIVNLDRREEDLFVDRHDPELRAAWREAYSRVMALWPPFKDEMTRKLELLATPRDINVTLTGHINDGDWPDADEVADFAQTLKSTIRFGEMFAVRFRPRADEVEVNHLLQCRFVPGPGDTVLLEITGDIELYESGDREANVNVNERLAHGEETQVYSQQGNADDDTGTSKIRFDFGA